MKDQRVAILDGSHSLYGPDIASSQASVSGSPKRGVQQSSSSHGDGLGLQPIPRFREILREAVGEVLASNSIGQHEAMGRGQIVLVDVGVVCETAAVRAVTRALHARVVDSLKE
jgi:mediator of RNA polymerase II transcription subunit 14